MYNALAFRETRTEVMHALMRAHPLATLVVLTAKGLEANHIPLLVDAFPAPDGAQGDSGAAASQGSLGVLRGHVARANPVWRTFDASAEVLAVFQGPQGYVTPSWYPSKVEHGKVVPTWNYAVVHAYGPLVIHDDAEWLRGLVTQLTQSHEAARERPWQVTDAPADYIDSMLKAIVGIEIPISRLEGKWKLSQNRLPQDREGVINALSEQSAQGDPGSAAMLREMGVASVKPA
jgi:transcriptional regulator